MPSLEDLLHDCLEAPPNERASRLAAACSSFPEHAESLRRMFAQLEGMGFLLLTGAAPTPQLPRWRPPEQLGTYRIDDEIGRGGMGVVYRARQQSLGDRVVALKMVRPDLVGDARAHARFLREALLASRLDHPNVCGVLEVGQTDGVAWLAMPFVAGRTLHELINAAHAQRGDDGRALPRLRPDTETTLDDVLRAFVALARGLAHAHDRGLVHRDVKPGNVLVTDDGRPVLLDFGLARELEQDTLLTLSQELLGTPAYMAPEQAARRSDLDARVDVYGLGATLYECLTLEVPHPAPTRDEMLRRIQHDPPPDARRLAPWLPRHVADVVRGALEPDRNRRYTSAAAFADDLQRALDRRPVLVRRPTAAQRAAYWVQRNPWPTAVGALLLLATAVSAILGTIASDNAREAREQARRFEAGDLIARSHEASARDDLLALEQAIAAVERDPENRRARDRLHQAMRTMRLVARVPIDEQAAVAARFVQGGEHLVAVFRGAVAVVDREGRVLQRVATPQTAQAAVLESAQGPVALLAGQDGVIRRWADGAVTELTGERAGTGRPGDTFACVAADEGHAYFGGGDGHLYRVSGAGGAVERWADGGPDPSPVSHCAVLAEGCVAWVCDTRKPTWRLAARAADRSFGPLDVPACSAMARGPGPTKLWLALQDSAVLLFDLDTGERRRFQFPTRTNAVALAADASYLYAGCFSGEVMRLTIGTGEQEAPQWFGLHGLHTGKVDKIVLDGDGRLFTIGVEDLRIQFSAANGRRLSPPLLGLDTQAYAVATDPRGSLIAVGTWNGALYLWGLRDPTHGIHHEVGPWFGGFVLASDDVALIAGPGNRVFQGDLTRGSYRVLDESRPMDGWPFLACHGERFVRAGLWLSLHGIDGTLLGEAKLPEGAAGVDMLDAATMLVAVNGGQIRKPRIQVWRHVDGKELHRTEDAVVDDAYRRGLSWHRAQFAADGSFLVASCYDGTVRVYARDGSRIGEPLRHSTGEFPKSVGQVAVSPDATRIVSAGYDGAVKTWRRGADGTFAFERVLTAFASDAFTVCLDRHGRRVACGSSAGRIRVVDLDGNVLEDFGATWARCLAFSSDGSRLHASLMSGNLVTWFLDPDELLRRAKALLPARR